MINLFNRGVIYPDIPTDKKRYKYSIYTYIMLFLCYVVLGCLIIKSLI